MAQTNLQFENKSSYYEAIASATSDFNIHLELELPGTIIILQKTSGNKYAYTGTFDLQDTIFDYDFTGYVYPKSIKVISYLKVNNGIITTNE